MLVYQRVIFLPSGQQDDVPRQAPLGLHYCDKEAVDQCFGEESAEALWL
jgi:hypothetical protein